mgnify:FL=1
MNSIMDILYIPFGYIMKLCCLISGNNYVIALFFFALLLQIVLFPLGIKQQKSQITMAKLRPKEMAIRKKYAGRTDRPTQQKMNMEIQQLYADNGYNPLSGCLPLLIQLPIIVALFAVVRNPITYTVNLGGNELDTHNLYVDAVNMLEEARTYMPAETDDAEIKAFSENLISWELTLGADLDDQNVFQGMGEPVNNGTSEYLLVQMITFGSDEINAFMQEKNLGQVTDPFGTEIKELMPNFNIIGGVSALQQPTFGLNWLLLVPILVFLSSYLSGIVMRKLSTMPENANGPGNGMFMKIGMPLISAIFAFSFPAAIGIYWIFRTVVGMGQQYLLYRMYPAPKFTPEEYAAAEKELRKSAKKKKVIMIEVDEDDDSYSDIEVKNGNSGASGSGKPRIEMLTPDDDGDDGTKADEGKKASSDAKALPKAPLKEENTPPDKEHKE